MDLIVDTTFLIGIWRRQQWAKSYAAANRSQSLGIPWVVLGEFWHGARRAGHDARIVQRFLEIGIPLCDPTDVIPVYAKICAELQSQAVYRSMGQNDLWIAATAIALDRPLISRNARHFGAVASLRLIALED